MSSPPPKHRWLAQGWPSYTEAHKAFRKVLADAVECGARPGDPLPATCNDFLFWLLEGHPRAAEMQAAGLSHFSFCKNGREGLPGLSFTAIDKNNRAHPFSVADALTGREHYVWMRDDDNPFKGMCS